MKANWIDRIAAEMHQVWMELYEQRDGLEKARQHKHYLPWKDLHSADGGVEAMDQDRFVASLILLAFAQGSISESTALPSLIHNSVQLWVRLTGEELKAHHVPYQKSDDPAINERMEKERTIQASRVWPMLQEIKNIAAVRECAKVIGIRPEQSLCRDRFPLTRAEHAMAQERAYYLAWARGGRKLPPYDYALAAGDFCEAAAQVMTERHGTR